MSRRLTLTPRKSAALALGVIGIAGLSFASAATLGGLGVSSLGADTSVVASCDTNGIQVGFTNAYAASSKSYAVQNVNLSGVADKCATLKATITLADSSGASLGEVTVASLALAGTTADAKTASVSFATAGIPASAVANVAVVINS